MIFGKIQIQKYREINKATKSVRNPHILRTLPILHLFEVFKFFWDFTWHGYCLNRFITLKGCSNYSRKKIKIHKYLKNYQPHILRTLPIFHFFELFKIF